ncbi:hypothetical protein DMB42_11435 [Nonomuraea sp. WAC 01424]|uniref:hypothetical protein n=1 Tax=Nonomuraea sp. WAC 01424 TaxID=2203200 RepID=UPI000F77791D|nr:hypothetical protein [Nonomuraea sp. WAC 01424]RSN12783.1 hypothetical protein DMB42_11435 [Nonomuraea sp. WAC 01424]
MVRGRLILWHFDTMTWSNTRQTISRSGEDGRVDRDEVDERMATERLRAALMDHILATEQQPPEVSERVREMYQDRRSSPPPET